MEKRSLEEEFEVFVDEEEKHRTEEEEEEDIQIVYVDIVRYKNNNKTFGY